MDHGCQVLLAQALSMVSPSCPHHALQLVLVRDHVPPDCSLTMHCSLCLQRTMHPPDRSLTSP